MQNFHYVLITNERDFLINDNEFKTLAHNWPSCSTIRWRRHLGLHDRASVLNLQDFVVPLALKTAGQLQALECLQHKE